MIGDGSVVDPFTPLEEAAAMLRECYLQMLLAGFTAEQAVVLTAALLRPAPVDGGAS